MILITGASGTVGRELAKRFGGRAMARLALRDPSCIEDAGVHDRVRFDFLDPSSFETALQGIDRVFLLRPPRLARALHDFGPFVAAMRRVGIGQVVFLSVRGTEYNALLPHRRIERLLETSGLVWTHLRPNDFMQNFVTVHRADIRDRGEIWAPAGRGRTSFVDVRDVADAAMRVLTEPGHGGRAYTLTGDEALDLAEVAAILSEVLGRRIIYRNPSILAFLRHVRSAGRPAALGLTMTGIYTIARVGLAAATSPDLKRLIARQPTSFCSFAEDHAAAWRSPSSRSTPVRAGSPPRSTGAAV
jgi:uncharacterized protein YbjT (DUF2867 family)